MSEPIKIIVTAETQAASTAVQDFTKKTVAGLGEVEKASHGAASGLNSNRMALMELGHSARSIADGLAAGMSPLRLAMMEAPRVAQAMGEASTAFRARLVAMLPMLGGVGVALAAGAIAWHYYGDAIVDPTKRVRELADALQKIPDMLKKIQTAEISGAISPQIAQKYRDMLSGKTPLYNKYTVSDGFGGSAQTFRPEGTLGLWGGTAVPDLTTNATSKSQVYSAWPGGLPAGTSTTDQHQLANASDRQKYVEYLMRKDGVTDANDQTKAADQAMVQLEDDQKRLQIESEQGLQKEIDRIKLRTELTQRQIELEKETVISAGGSKSQAEAVLKAGTDANNLAAQNEIAKLRQDAATEAAQKQAEAENKIREAAAKDGKQQIDNLETQITANENEQGQKRSQQFLAEYVDRVALYTKLAYQGKLSEDEYNAKVVEATKKAQEAQEKYNQELQKESELRLTIARSQAQGQLEQIRGNPFLTDEQKAKQSIGPTQALMAANQDEMGSLSNIAQNSHDDAARLEARRQLVELTNQQVQLQQQLNDLEGRDSFAYQFQKVLTQMQNMPSLAEQTAHLFQSVWTTATSSIESNLSKVLEGTETWHKALLTIGTQVVDQMIQGFVKMGVSWVEQHLLMAAATKIFNELIKQSSGESTLTVLENLYKQITGYAGTAAGGAASAVASVPYVGPVLAVAAAASMFADVIGFAAGFESGGFTGNIPTDRVAGLVHGQEFVFNAPSVNRIGIENLEALHNGASLSAVAGSAESSAVGSNSSQAKVLVVNDRQEMMKFLKSPEAANTVVAHVYNNRLKAGIRT